jgi:hypothetical protein
MMRNFIYVYPHENLWNPTLLYRHLAFRCICRPCCCNQKPIESVVLDDNCCGCNFAAFTRMCHLPDIYVVYITYHVDVGETPFVVAIDYAQQSIVVSIRGTLSLQVNKKVLFERKRRRKLRSNFRRSGSEFIILRIPMTEKCPFWLYTVTGDKKVECSGKGLMVCWKNWGFWNSFSYKTVLKTF